MKKRNRISKELIKQNFQQNDVIKELQRYVNHQKEYLEEANDDIEYLERKLNKVNALIKKIKKKHKKEISNEHSQLVKSKKKIKSLQKQVDGLTLENDKFRSFKYSLIDSIRIKYPNANAISVKELFEIKTVLIKEKNRIDELAIIIDQNITEKNNDDNICKICMDRKF